MDFNVDLHDTQSLVRKYQHAGPIVLDEMAKALSRSQLIVSRTAKELVPVDTGRLRASITIEPVDRSATVLVGRVGTNVKYAKAVEYGSGLLSEAPDSGHRRYYPPPAALDKWAIRHGFTPYSAATSRKHIKDSPGTYGAIVSQIIFRRGGIAPKPYLRPALKNNLAKINEEFSIVARRVMERIGAARG